MEGALHRKNKLKDPWDTEFGYEVEGRNFKLISAGFDGEFGTSDDVSYPDEEE